MPVFSCFATTSEVDPTENVLPRLQEIPLCLVLTTGSSIPAVMCGIPLNNIHFKAPIHHIMTKHGYIGNATSFGDTRPPPVHPTHIRHSYRSPGTTAKPNCSNEHGSILSDTPFEAVCKTRGELQMPSRHAHVPFHYNYNIIVLTIMSIAKS